MAKGVKSAPVRLTGQDEHPSGPAGLAVRSTGRVDLSAALREYISSRGLSHGVSADSPDQRREQLRLARDAGTAAKILQGFWLLQIREEEGKEAFLSAAAELRIGRTAAYDAVSTLMLFNRLPDFESVAALGQLEPTKALILKSWTDDELVKFARGEQVNGIDLDAAVEVSGNELESQQRQWQREHDDELAKLEREKVQLQNQLDIVKNERNKLARAGAALQCEDDLPHFALVVRQESMALTEQMSFCLDNLQAIINEHLFAEVKHPDAEKYQPVAAGTAYFALAGIYARCRQQMAAIEAEYAAATSMLTAEHQLSTAEVERFGSARQQLLAVHEAASQRRENERENNRAGKRGRKRS